MGTRHIYSLAGSNPFLLWIVWIGYRWCVDLIHNTLIGDCILAENCDESPKRRWRLFEGFSLNIDIVGQFWPLLSRDSQDSLACQVIKKKDRYHCIELMQYYIRLNRSFCDSRFGSAKWNIICAFRACVKTRHSISAPGCSLAKISTNLNRFWKQ